MPPKIYKKWMHRELEALSIHEFEREGGDWRIERRVCVDVRFGNAPILKLQASRLYANFKANAQRIL
jgi:hypothetical protein